MVVLRFEEVLDWDRDWLELVEDHIRKTPAKLFQAKRCQLRKRVVLGNFLVYLRKEFTLCTANGREKLKVIDEDVHEKTRLETAGETTEQKVSLRQRRGAVLPKLIEKAEKREKKDRRRAQDFLKTITAARKLLGISENSELTAERGSKCRWQKERRRAIFQFRSDDR